MNVWNSSRTYINASITEDRRVGNQSKLRKGAIFFLDFLTFYVFFPFFIDPGPAVVVSKCEMNTFSKTSIDSLQATATLRTGTYAGSDKCERFHISFWCKFGRIPNVADKSDPSRFFLQLDMHRRGRNGALIDGTGLPSRNLWGSQISDYQGIGLNEWQKIVFSFTEFEQFSLMFFAHHNDGCDQTKLSLIHLDSVVVERG
jgi:hypothetical protein